MLPRTWHTRLPRCHNKHTCRSRLFSKQLALLCRLLPYMFYNAFVLFPSKESPKPLLTQTACIKIVDVALVSICGRFFYLFRCPRRIFKLVTSRSMIREEAEVAKLRTYFLNCVLLFLKEDCCYEAFKCGDSRARFSKPGGSAAATSSNIQAISPQP